jgi:hypothetical protein
LKLPARVVVMEKTDISCGIPDPMKGILENKKARWGFTPNGL